jgi:hypothetical protein
MLVFTLNAIIILPSRFQARSRGELPGKELVGISFFFDAVLLLLIPYYWWREYHQIRIEGAGAYFLNQWNYIDILVNILVPAAVILDLLDCTNIYTVLDSLGAL